MKIEIQLKWQARTPEIFNFHREKPVREIVCIKNAVLRSQHYLFLVPAGATFVPYFGSGSSSCQILPLKGSVS